MSDRTIHACAADFPQIAGGLVYCDSAASSLTPAPVLNRMDEYYRTMRANVHRGLYPEALAASRAYDGARVTLATWIGADSNEIVWTSGATAGSNMLIRMIESSLSLAEGDEIVTTVMEHHSALVPLQELAKRRSLTLKFIPLDETNTRLDLDAAAKLIGPKTKLVSAMHASNVLGTINDVRALADLAHAAGALMLVDATASAGHAPLNVRSLGADALYFSGHKMFGPTGIGVLYLSSELASKLEPAVFGGDMVERVLRDRATWCVIPRRFEAGTQNIAGVLGMAAAAKYLDELGLEQVREHVRSLVARAIGALEELPGVRVVGERDPERNIGSVAFTVEGIHPHDVAEVLARDHIAVRAGHHCAMPLHDELGLAATTRASFHAYNTEDDISRLVDGVARAIAIFAK
ncbi:MAG TPA: cysteine desulfurase [Candidatus Paceibacterota bacterium]|nr:cysteine desulfurase [Candidatus Paceibacterota bacterium]